MSCFNLKSFQKGRSDSSIKKKTLHCSLLLPPVPAMCSGLVVLFARQLVTNSALVPVLAEMRDACYCLSIAYQTLPSGCFFLPQTQSFCFKNDLQARGHTA